MATVLSSLQIATGSGLGFRRSVFRPRASPASSLLSSSSHPRPGFGFVRAVCLHKKPRGVIAFASSGEPADQSNESNKPSLSGSDSPPLATILAGIVVFLLFLWLVGSIVMWIVGLIVNAPKS